MMIAHTRCEGGDERMIKGHLKAPGKFTIPSFSLFCYLHLFPSLSYPDYATGIYNVIPAPIVSLWTNLFSRPTSRHSS